MHRSQYTCRSWLGCCADFLRLGALRRVHRQLLPHTLHCSGDKGGHKEAVHELQEMLKAAAGPEETALLQAELASVRARMPAVMQAAGAWCTPDMCCWQWQVQAGAERKRKKLLSSASIVGMTCCSSALPVLDGQAFDIVVLDEGSQITEPLALLPITRAGCRRAHVHALICARRTCMQLLLRP